jgi:signal peptide peptidase SppA
MKSYSHIARAVMTRPWAINRQSVEWAAIKDVIAHRVAGEPFSDEQIRDRLRAAARPRTAVIGSDRQASQIMVLPIFGVLMPRADLMLEMSGGASVGQLSAAFAEAVADDSVAAIILDIDSPGGLVSGIPEFGQQILEARDVKPIVAVADTMAASAAYWLASQASDFSITPSGWVGSVGVFSEHENWEKFWEEVGMEHTFVQYGENKTGGNEFEPLSDHEREQMQTTVDYFGRMFDQAVARGRGVSASTVKESFGQGDMFTAEDAVSRGMADRVETLGQALERVGTEVSSPSGGSALRAVGAKPFAVTVDPSMADPADADPEVAEAVDEEDPALEMELVQIAARRRRRARG